MATLKLLHIVCVFIWLGNLLALTRILGYIAKEKLEIRQRVLAILWRMYKFVGIPVMILAMSLGFLMIGGLDTHTSLGWFHLKLTAVLGLFFCDMTCAFFLSSMEKEGKKEKGPLPKVGKYKALHGICGLLLITIIYATFVKRDKNAEIEEKYKNTITIYQNLDPID